MVSIDGYFEGENHDLSWHNVDSEFNDFAIEQLNESDTILFGRKTYELMRDFWPTENAKKVDPQAANLMNNTPKIVFSKTLESVEETEFWKNVRLVPSNPVEVIKKLKNLPGKDIAILGSNNLVVSLLDQNVIDEFRIMVNPVTIGKGTPLFYGIDHEVNFKLVKTRQFKNGNILLYYTSQKS